MTVLDVLTVPAEWATPLLVVEYVVKLVAIGTVPAGRNPSSSQAWLLAILLLPVVGVPLFFLFGSPWVRGRRNRIQEEANLLFAEVTEDVPTVPPAFHVEPGLASLMHMNRVLTSLPGATGRIDAVHTDTAESLASMTRAVRDARRYVHVEFYAQSYDAATAGFYDELFAAAARGVEVRLLVDQLGSIRYRGHWALRRRLRGSGVQWHYTMPINPLRGRFRRPDLRNHRKLLIVDGEVGFIGSQNLISPYYGSVRGERAGRAWHDLMARVRGDVVLSLDAVFGVDWYTESGEVVGTAEQGVRDLASPAVSQPEVNTELFQVVPSGPGYRTEPGMRMFAQLACQAERTLSVVSPYLVPNEAMMESLTSASYRGVDVEVFVPAKADQFVVDHAQRSYFQTLLDAGVTVWLFPSPGVLHTKLVLADEEVGVFGSSNLDMRSFMLNFELSLMCVDGETPRQLAEVVDGYRTRCRQLTAEEWAARPMLVRYVDNVAKLTSALQ